MTSHNFRVTLKYLQRKQKGLELKFLILHVCICIHTHKCVSQTGEVRRQILKALSLLMGFLGAELRLASSVALNHV